MKKCSSILTVIDLEILPLKGFELNSPARKWCWAVLISPFSKWIMFISPILSNIENVGFVLLLGLKAAVLYLGTDATPAETGRIDSK